MQAEKCLSDGMLAKFNSGELDDSAIDEVAAHLATCSSCNKRLESIEAVSSRGMVELFSLIKQSYDSHDERAVLAKLKEKNTLNVLSSFGTNEHSSKLPGNSVSTLNSLNNVETDEQNFELETDEEIPPTTKRIGRYSIIRVLGEGGFGRVYLAADDELHRNVALKVPHQHRIQTEAERSASHSN